MQPTELKTTNKNQDRRRKKKKKNVKNTFFLCFQPVTMDGLVNPDSGNGDGKLGFKYISTKDNDGGVVFPNVLPDSSSPSVDNESAAANPATTPRKKKLGRRSLSRVLKALLFEASLIKKLKKRKLREKLNRSYPESSANTVKNSEPPSEISLSNNVEDNTNRRRSISNSSSSLRSSSVIASTSLCSSCGSSLSDRNNSNKSSFRLNISSDQRKLQDNINNVQVQVQEQGKGYYGVDFGLCLVVLSLVVLVFWGKVCAIFCTSTWLFFVPRRSIRSDSRNEDTPEFDSEQYKKKIIMEGLLERNRNRSL